MKGCCERLRERSEQNGTVCVNSHRTTALRCPYLFLHGTGNSEDEGTSKSQPVHKTVAKKSLGSEQGRKTREHSGAHATVAYIQLPGWRAETKNK